MIRQTPGSGAAGSRSAGAVEATSDQAAACTGPRRESVGRALALTAKAVRELFDARLTAEGGSLPTWIVLAQAIEAPVSPSQSELAGRMGIGGATLVRHLDRLEGEGLVVRRRDERDRRVTRVDITAAGRRRHRQLAVVADQLDREIKALMSDEDEETFRSILDRLATFALAAPRPAGAGDVAPPPGLDEALDETDVA